MTFYRAQIVSNIHNSCRQSSAIPSIPSRTKTPILFQPPELRMLKTCVITSDVESSRRQSVPLSPSTHQPLPESRLPSEPAMKSQTNMKMRDLYHPLLIQTPPKKYLMFLQFQNQARRHLSLSIWSVLRLHHQPHQRTSRIYYKMLGIMYKIMDSRAEVGEEYAIL
jgi:hypothetical protein